MSSEPKRNQHDLLNKIRYSWTTESQPLGEGGQHSPQDWALLQHKNLPWLSCCLSTTHQVALRSSLRATFTRHLKTSTGVWGGLKRWAMHHQTKEDSSPPKMEENEEPPMTASAEVLDNPTSETPTEQAPAVQTPDPCHGCGCLCQPWCLLLALTMLLLSLLGSWAVVHLTLGTHGGAPFRVSASYDQRVPQDDTATIEPRFTTNCTMGKPPYIFYLFKKLF